MHAFIAANTTRYRVLCVWFVELFFFFKGVFKFAEKAGFQRAAEGRLQSRRDVQWRERVGTAVCRQEFRCNFQTETVVNSLGGG